MKLPFLVPDRHRTTTRLAIHFTEANNRDLGVALAEQIIAHCCNAVCMTRRFGGSSRYSGLFLSMVGCSSAPDPLDVFASFADAANAKMLPAQ